MLNEKKLNKYIAQSFEMHDRMHWRIFNRASNVIAEIKNLSPSDVNFKSDGKINFNQDKTIEINLRYNLDEEEYEETVKLELYEILADIDDWGKILTIYNQRDKVPNAKEFHDRVIGKMKKKIYKKYNLGN